MTPAHLRGQAAEYAVAAYYLGRGRQVYWPAVPSGPHDFLVDDPLERIQVKCASWVQGKGANDYLVIPMERGRRYRPGDFDVLAAVDGPRLWLIPYSAVHRVSMLRLDARGPTVRPTTASGYRRWLTNERLQE